MNAPGNIEARFEDWLLRETGISAATLGVHAFERAVRQRARVTLAGSAAWLATDGATAGATDSAAAGDIYSDAQGEAPLPQGALEAYWQLLTASPEERQALVELIVVPETWFFRDREAFAALARLANERLVREPSHVLRLLSAPCSTGEEPYTMAMALLDAGIGPDRFTVDAVDISARALEFARGALYGRNSFRGRALEFRDRHFYADESGYRLNERARHAVRFAQANLFDATQMPDARFDFIFCRNVLIYFDRASQDRAIRLLDARLAQHGSLFVGPAETGLMMRHAFSSARIPLAFAFQRTPRDETAARAGSGEAWASSSLNPAQSHAARPFAMQTHGVPVHAGAQAHAAGLQALRPGAASAALMQTGAHAKTAGSPLQALHASPAAKPASGTRPLGVTLSSGASSASPKSPTSPARSNPQASATPTDAHATLAAALDHAQRLADAGRLDEAFRAASDCVIVHGPDAAVFYLLGLIMDARGRGADAGDYYRKALYLQPDHYEALTHLAALLEMNGDSAGAERFTLRAQRAAAQQREALKPAGRTRGLHD
jgi:chemotaxis protein methyltransferase WspC